MTLLILCVSSCAKEQRLTVRATAFNSTRAQTDHRPTEAACGDKLKPGNKVVAVSADLVAKGLTCGTEIRIAGLDGKWTVVDRTAARKKEQIDIYMGKDIKAAREWGVREVEISWRE
jgi:3D (Asp-Asp-Asp) domain-containing protein